MKKKKYPDHKETTKNHESFIKKLRENQLEDMKVLKKCNDSINMKSCLCLKKS